MFFVITCECCPRYFHVHSYSCVRNTVICIIVFSYCVRYVSAEFIFNPNLNSELFSFSKIVIALSEWHAVRPYAVHTHTYMCFFFSIATINGWIHVFVAERYFNANSCNGGAFSRWSAVKKCGKEVKIRSKLFLFADRTVYFYVECTTGRWWLISDICYSTTSYRAARNGRNSP